MAWWNDLLQNVALGAAKKGVAAVKNSAPTRGDLQRMHRGTSTPAASKGSSASYGTGSGSLTTDGSWTPGTTTEDTGGGYDPYAAAQAAANASARSASQKQNDATRKAAEAKYGLLAAYKQQADTKLGNITKGLTASDSSLLGNYRTSLGGLLDTLEDNDKAQSDASFANISNTLRERGDILNEVASQGAGETDALRAQLSALQNYDANQGEVNRSFYDTLRSGNRAISGLNVETLTSRKNLYDRAEDDRESVYSNLYNQQADAWNEIFNIENSNTNVESESSVAYNKKFADAEKKAAAAVKSSYKKKAFDDKLKTWDGMGTEQERDLVSNKSTVINLGNPQKRPEGATLRKW